MSNKMLIDASHPEETRVAVVRGNRIEEFDFESQEKKQLRGNIYLAKVTRVEPSLQAAFVDYGGNRHGFLAFSEIHPDYYQIPVADRQALLDAEAEDARASREAEEEEDNNVVEVSSDDDEEDEAPKKKPRRRQAKDEVDGSEPEVEKPKRRSTRRKKAPVAKKEEIVEAAEEKTEAETLKASSEDEANGDDGEDDGNPTTMAAMVEMDSISEPLPEDTDESEDNDNTSDDEPVAEEKPKPSEEVTETAAEETQAEDTEAEAEKPKKRAPRRNSRKKKEAAAEEEKSDTSEENSDADNGSDDSEEEGIESVGQEDALEEVPTPPRRQRRHYKIQEVIKRRQVLLVQVVKEERGNKGAALTTYLSLAGRYSVLMPNTARGGGISRKITNAADRKRLKAVATGLEVPQGMGVILRTAGASRTNAEIERDFDYLMRLWEQVRNLTLSSSAPCLVYEEGSLIKRSIRDLYDKDTGEVLVAGENGFQEAKDFMTMLMPTAAKRVKLHRDKQAIFAKFGVETQLDKMVTPQVTLKSGGYLIIDQTEALVAVDVNSGRSTREHSIENTALQTNLEAGRGSCAST
ncbi:Ribonuclease E [Nymphon striatum]|nr:Ribonuclease E [Nymphon striatum]